MWSVEKPHERKHRRRAKRREKQINEDLDAIIASFEARNDTQMAALTQELKTRVDDSCDLAVPSQYYCRMLGPFISWLLLSRRSVMAPSRRRRRRAKR